jgi:ABC-type polysaccharide/polyol phosphate export permease
MSLMGGGLWGVGFATVDLRMRQGSLLSLAVLILLGALTFSGIGLLVASRARTLEAVSGLMNLVMLPMWVLSGIFFSPERFPAAAQPFIQALPLTALINALRSVSLKGASLMSQWAEVAILVAWGGGSFVLALRWFRWN